jgi:hypothetical protein
MSNLSISIIAFMTLARLGDVLHHWRNNFGVGLLNLGDYRKALSRSVDKILACTR